VRLGACGRDGRPLLGFTLSLSVSTIAWRAGGAGLVFSLTGAAFSEEVTLDGVLCMALEFLTLPAPDLTLSGLSCLPELNPFLESSLELNSRSP